MISSARACSLCHAKNRPRDPLYDEYRKTHPDGYGKSQFYEHLKQNLVAQKDITTVLAMTYKPGEKLMVDFAGDKMPYIDPETGCSSTSTS